MSAIEREVLRFLLEETCHRLERAYIESRGENRRADRGWSEACRLLDRLNEEPTP